MKTKIYALTDNLNQLHLVEAETKDVALLEFRIMKIPNYFKETPVIENLSEFKNMKAFKSYQKN